MTMTRTCSSQITTTTPGAIVKSDLATVLTDFTNSGVPDTANIALTFSTNTDGTIVCTATATWVA